jgi:predicted DNA-binding transcriptional regulator YafY
MDKERELKLAEAAALLASITPEIMDNALEASEHDSAIAYRLLDKILNHDPANRLMYTVWNTVLDDADLPNPENPEEFKKFEAAIALMTLVMLGYRLHEAQTASTVDLGMVN